MTSDVEMVCSSHVEARCYSGDEIVGLYRMSHELGKLLAAQSVGSTKAASVRTVRAGEQVFV